MTVTKNAPWKVGALSRLSAPTAAFGGLGEAYMGIRRWNSERCLRAAAFSSGIVKILTLPDPCPISICSDPEQLMKGLDQILRN
jgi:hypothetical protein